MGLVPTVTIITPMSIELRPVVAALALRRDGNSTRRFVGEVGALRVVALLGGVGPAAAEACCSEAIRRDTPDHVVVAGIAGGLAPTLRIGDLVIASEAVLHGDPRVVRATGLGSHTASGRIITTDTILSDAELAADIAAGFTAVDMETAVIGAVCEDAGVPWSAFRGISDRVGEGVIDDSTMELVNNDGTTNLGAVARRLVRDPSAVRRLARMRRDSNAAAAAAATATASAVRHLAAE